jgi:hypothetical protein
LEQIKGGYPVFFFKREIKDPNRRGDVIPTICAKKEPGQCKLHVVAQDASMKVNFDIPDIPSAMDRCSISFLATHRGIVLPRTNI